MTAPPPPLTFTWDGEAMRPLRPKAAAQHFAPGAVYTLEERQDRSPSSHNHFFAAVAEAWASLPEPLADRFPTPDHLRKYALIRAGFRDERSIACASKAEAQRLAAFVKPLDDFSLVLAREALVIVFTAKSQSLRAMGRADFQRSKDAVLAEIARLLGTTATEIEQASAA